MSDDLIKTREIAFAMLPPDQGQQAWLLLAGLKNLEVRQFDRKSSLHVTYSLEHYSLESLETALVEQGFHLDNGLFAKLRRALIYYCESVQIENMQAPEHLLKSAKVFAEIYEHHPHGDKDETPEEWRTYR